MYILWQRERVHARLQCITLFQKLHEYFKTDLQALILQPLKKVQPSTKLIFFIAKLQSLLDSHLKNLSLNNLHLYYN